MRYTARKDLLTDGMWSVYDCEDRCYFKGDLCCEDACSLARELNDAKPMNFDKIKRVGWVVVVFVFVVWWYAPLIILAEICIKFGEWLWAGADWVGDVMDTAKDWWYG